MQSDGVMVPVPSLIAHLARWAHVPEGDIRAVRLFCFEKCDALVWNPIIAMTNHGQGRMCEDSDVLM